MSDNELAIQPLYAEALDALGRKAWDEARNKLERVLKQAPQFVPALCSLGVLLTNAGMEEGQAYLKRAVELAPEDREPWRSLGYCYRRAGRVTQARACLERALALEPNDPQTLMAMTKVLRAQKDLAALLKVTEQLLLQRPEDPALHIERAEVLLELGREEDAARAYDALFRLNKLPTRAFEKWTALMIQREELEQARTRLSTLIAANPKNPVLLSFLAQIEIQDANNEKAHDLLAQATALAPRNPRFAHDLGVVLRHLGRIEESASWFAKSLDLDPFNSSSLRIYGMEHKYAIGDEPYSRLLQAAAHLDEYKAPAQVQLYYGLGKAHDDIGDLKTAMEFYVSAGRVQKKIHKYSAVTGEKLYEKFRAMFTKEFFESNAQSGYESEKPVFVLGMPRSGTSLVEQILASHPRVYGAGELKLIGNVLDGISLGSITVDLNRKKRAFQTPEPRFRERGEAFLKGLEERAAGDYDRIVDKMPANFAWIGFIQLMLPNSKIIHCRRHPMEICLSNFRIFFPDGQGWSYDLKDLGRYYRRYHDTMQLWRDTLPPERILEVRYEDVVADVETQARRMLGYLGLPWDDACLNFHETDRPVRTASASQVRKPIYKTSTNRWRKYEPYLKPLLDELGPLVEEYEAEIARDYPAADN